MKTVEQLAREAELYLDGANKQQPLYVLRPEELQRFHDLAIAQYREGLLAGVGEPHYWTQRIADDTVNMVPFYYPDQMAAAVAIEREGCAKVCERGEYAIDGGGNHYYRPADARWCAKAIRGQK